MISKSSDPPKAKERRFPTADRLIVVISFKTTHLVKAKLQGPDEPSELSFCRFKSSQ